MRILLTGGTGQLGWELRHALPPVGEVVAPPRGLLDLERPDSIRTAIRQVRPDVIVNAGAFAAMDPAEAEPERAMRVNGVAPGVIGAEAARLGALLVHFSSAYIFDGTATRPYPEDDPPNPINAYGKSKLAGEQAILDSGVRHVILRLSWIHSLRGANFLTAILRLAREEPEIPVVGDQIGSPTWARSVAQATAQVLARHRDADAPTGVFNLSAAGAVSRSAFAEEIIAIASGDTGDRRAWARVIPVSSAEYAVAARRPRYCLLDNSRMQLAFGIELPAWHAEVRACLAEQSDGATSGDT